MELLLDNFPFTENLRKLPGMSAILAPPISVDILSKVAVLIANDDNNLNTGILDIQNIKRIGENLT